MKKILFILSMGSLLWGCGKVEKEQEEYMLQGVWMARHGEFPTGETWDYSPEEGDIFCRIFDGDSMTYKCRLSVTDGNIVMLPLEKCEITMINKGGGEILYLEDGDPHPFTIVNDSTITIQMNGVRNTWVRDDKMTQEWSVEMRDFIANATGSGARSDIQYYVLSAKEREQESVIHGLVFVVMGIVVALLILVQVIISNQRSKRHLQRQLIQIQEEHEARPQPVRQAMMEVEEAFFASEAYATLHKRITNGEALSEEDWDEVEKFLKQVYPGFSSKLRSLYRMSELEYQVCLLIKLRIAPKDIANILYRDVSTISTVRSRLYQKVFGHKGGAKEWDDFILSIST